MTSTETKTETSSSFTYDEITRAAFFGYAIPTVKYVRDLEKKLGVKSSYEIMFPLHHDQTTRVVKSFDDLAKSFHADGVKFRQFVSRNDGCETYKKLKSLADAQGAQDLFDQFAKKAYRDVCINIGATLANFKANNIVFLTNIEHEDILVKEDRDPLDVFVKLYEKDAVIEVNRDGDLVDVYARIRDFKGLRDLLRFDLVDDDE